MPEPSDAVAILKGLASVPEPVIKAAVGFVESLLGKPFKVAGDAISDQIRMWKWENRVRCAARAMEIMREEEIAVRVVPPEFLLPVVEAAGYEGDSTLNEMWARLLASGAKDDRYQQPMFIRILRDFSPEDARVLKRAVEWCAQGPSHGIGVAIDRSTESSRAALRLEANGLLERRTEHSVLGHRNLYLPEGGPPVLPIWEVAPTPLAKVLYEAVTRPN